MLSGWLLQMKIKNYNKVVFWTVSIIFLLFFILCLPTYIELNVLDYPEYVLPLLSRKIFYSYIKSSRILSLFDEVFVHNVPTWSIPTAILINGLNMYSGSHSLKNKWWYYLVCAVCLVISFLLIDCYALYTEDSV